MCDWVGLFVFLLVLLGCAELFCVGSVLVGVRWVVVVVFCFF